MPSHRDSVAFLAQAQAYPRSPSKRYSAHANSQDNLAAQNDSPYTHSPPRVAGIDETRKTKRKSVTFSAVDHVPELVHPTRQDHQRSSKSVPDVVRVSAPEEDEIFTPTKRRSMMPPGVALHVATNTSSPRTKRISMMTLPITKVPGPISQSRPQADEHTPPSSPRKRRYSNVGAPSSGGYDTYQVSEESEGDEEQPSPRKRRFSVVNRDQSPRRESRPIQVFQIPESDTTDFPHVSPSKRPKSYNLHPSPHTPPAKICSDVNDRVRDAFCAPRFDFERHVKHRTYVVRALRLGQPYECVTMLDVGVDALVPELAASSCKPSRFSMASSTSLSALTEPSSGTSFGILKAPLKGLGMFSRRLISPNEVVLREHPVMVMPSVIGLAVPIREVYKDLFGKLSEDVRREVIGLLEFDLATGGEEGADGVGAYEKLVKLHALAIDLDVPDDEEYPELSTHRGIFLQMSRCNHSCGPNAKWEWDRTTFSLVLTAVRRINQGDEITISYVPVHLPFYERREKLLSIYGFECLCVYCTQSAEVIRQSDSARATLSTFWDDQSEWCNQSPDEFEDNDRVLPSFEAWCIDKSIPSTILLSAHKRALALIEREGLEILDTSHFDRERRRAPHAMRDAGRHIDVIAMCYGALGDVEMFQVWIARASQGREKEMLAFRKWMSNPLEFPVWEWRKTMCEGGDEEKRKLKRSRLGKKFDSDDEHDALAGLAACVKMGMF